MLLEKQLSFSRIFRCCVSLFLPQLAVLLRNQVITVFSTKPRQNVTPFALNQLIWRHNNHWEQNTLLTLRKWQHKTWHCKHSFFILKLKGAFHKSSVASINCVCIIYYQVLLFVFRYNTKDTVFNRQNLNLLQIGRKDPLRPPGGHVGRPGSRISDGSILGSRIQFHSDIHPTIHHPCSGYQFWQFL